jgi:hypothetical protein
MEAAREAVARAENDANAGAYAPNPLVRAKNALARMEDEALAKRYDAAKDYALEAVDAAEQAVRDGAAGLARARDDAARLLESVRELIITTESELAQARQKRLPRAQDLDQDLNEAKLLAADARADLDGARSREAPNKGERARSVLTSFRAELQNSVQQTKRK